MAYKDPKKAKENYLRYRKRHLEEIREKDRIQKRIWRKENPEKVKEINRKCYLKYQKKRILDQRNYRLKSPEKVKESNRKCYYKYREERCKMMREYRDKASPEKKKEWYQYVQNWHKENPLRRKEWHFAKKFEIMSHYTNEQFNCQNCGMIGISFLTIDHIECRKKLQHDRNTGSGEVYRYILKNKFPIDFQILCFNCNMKKEILREKKLSQTRRSVWRRLHRKQLKIEVFSKICQSNPHCQCCGYDDVDGLSVDHIYGRKKMGHDRSFRSGDLYSWLKRNDYPPGYQVLCLSCNAAKGQSGQCPHKKMEMIQIE